MSTPAATGLTWEEFLVLPEVPEYRHAELVDGEIVTNPPTPLHQLAVANVMTAITLRTREADGRGEATMDPPVQIGPRRGYLPDVAWYRQERCAPPDQPPAFEGPPDLVVEVLSPSTRTFDALRKRNDYARVGVSELWLIDPGGPTVMVFRRPTGAASDAEFDTVAELGPDDTLSSPLLASFSMPVSGLSAR